MKQVLQDLRSGAVSVHDVPEPTPERGYVLVAVEHSLISSGTERAVASLGSKSLLQKARARPDLVRKTIDVARVEGVGAAAAKVRSRLDQHSAFGYSLAGRVLETGGDGRFAPGDRVACVGSGHASHAEVVSVPANLVVLLPAGVEAADAAFAAPAAIALHALRLAGVGPGATVVVVGLGLIGQLAGRLIEASGGTAVGTDPREDRVARFGAGAGAGADQVAALVNTTSRGRGADAVLVCAATSSSEPVALATELARDKARIVVVGDVGLELDRRALYEKELELVVARSYGPGRYERDYEERGVDYPAGYVRWTEGRNVEAVVDLLARGSLRVGDLVTHRFSIAEGERAYAALDEPDALGIVIEYPGSGEQRERTIRLGPTTKSQALRVGLVGAGAFMRGTLVPALREQGVAFAAVCARSGASAASLAERLEAPIAGTDAYELVRSPDLDAIVVATPHSSHARIAAAALEQGKSVWVEKPLAVSWEQLGEVAARAQSGLLLVGHNRRFAPLAQTLKEAVGGRLMIHIRVGAGPLAPGHWLQDPEEGGRVLGEISHFVDLASFLAGGAPTSVSGALVPSSAGAESLAGLLRFANGSAATIAYGVGESSGLSKERVEVLGPDGAAVLDDFQRLELHGTRQTTVKSKRDKGHAAAIAAFVAAASGRGELPVSADEQLLVAAASLALLDSARSGAPVEVRLPS